MGDEQKVEGDGYAEPIHGPLCSLLDGECVSCHCVKCGAVMSWAAPCGACGHGKRDPEAVSD